MRRLASAVVFELADDMRTFEYAALAAVVGFTNIFKRPTVGETDLVAGDLDHCRGELA